MIRDRQNVVPVTMALLLHVAVFGSLVVVLDLRRPVQPAVPLAIRGMLVTDNAVVIPPVAEQPPPEPTAEERAALEEQKRLDDARVEQQRLQQLERIRQQEAEQRRVAEEQERIRQQEAEQRRVAEEQARQRAAEEERRRREAEAEQERQRAEAERRRQQEVERQRAENERIRQEREAAARQAEIDAEARRLEAVQADARAAYMFAIQQRIQRSWVRPPTATAGIECVVNISQAPGGEVLSVSIGSCNADPVVRQSIERAVHQASPLPTPRDPGLFERNIRLIFRPED